MKIKVINPNTTASMTEKIATVARAVASPGTEIIACNPQCGLASIEGHYDEAMSIPGILAEVRSGELVGVDDYVIACFGDPGLLAVRELATGPAIVLGCAGMADKRSDKNIYKSRERPQIKVAPSHSRIIST